MTPSAWPFFTLDELKCKCGRCDSSGGEMRNDFMNKLITLRRQLNFPFVITSAYRCPKHNSAVSGTGANGPHTTGAAIDIAVRGKQAYDLIKAAANAGFTGIGVNQKGASRFIHLDILTEDEGYPRPAIWSY